MDSVKYIHINISYMTSIKKSTFKCFKYSKIFFCLNDNTA